MVASDVRPDIALASGEFWGRNPHDELAWLRRHAPVYWDEAGGVWGVATYDLVRDVSKRPERLLQRRRHPARDRADPDDDRHGRPGALRPAQAGQQGASRRSGSATRSRRCARSSTGSSTRCASAGECDFVWDLAAWLPLIIIGDALGFERGRPPDAAAVVRRPAAGPRPATTPSCWRRPPRRSSATRATSPRSSTTGGAARTTTSSACSSTPRSTATALDDDEPAARVAADPDRRRRDHPPRHHRRRLPAAHRPGQWERLRGRPLAHADSAVEEMLRWVSPIKNMARTATRDVELGGQDIEGGRRSCCSCTRRPTATRRCSTDPFRFDIRAHARTTTWRSASARTSAWGTRSPASS